VLEIGAGRGVNFDRLPTGVTWTGLEPDPKRRAALAASAAHHGHAGRAVAGVAEHLPLADQSMDTVVETVMLCSVADQRAVLAEVRRVLKPGGAFVFVEHVAAAHGSWTRRAQDAFAPFSRRFLGGCDPARETWQALADAGFAEVDYAWFRSRWPLPVTTLRIVGVARA
jgi:ubiquinone/menaquinone biosynthesis C-methylase UbiE